MIIRVWNYNEFKSPVYSIGLDFQTVDGNYDFSLITGNPARYFIDWTQGLFNKQDEDSYYLNMKYKLDAVVAGLDIGYRYIYGENFKTAGKDNREIKRDIVLNYTVQ